MKILMLSRLWKDYIYSFKSYCSTVGQKCKRITLRAKKTSDNSIESKSLTVQTRVCDGQVNANDDRGVIFGRWDGEYSDGVAPTRWTGSVPILRRWSEGGAQRVRYGQCWVFSAVACTSKEIIYAI